MVAQSRHIGILSRLKVPFVKGEPDGQNMDICPDRDHQVNRGPFELFAVLWGRPTVRQERTDSRRVADGGSVRRGSNINQQIWLTDKMASIGNGRLSQPRWISGGI